MAKGKKTGGRDFLPGNPGKPKGTKDKVPRGLMKRIVIGLIEGDQKTLISTLRKNLKDKDRAIRLAEFAARLNQEIGIEAVDAPPPVVINFNSPVSPGRLRQNVGKRGQPKPDR